MVDNEPSETDEKLSRRNALTYGATLSAGAVLGGLGLSTSAAAQRSGPITGPNPDDGDQNNDDGSNDDGSNNDGSNDDGSNDDGPNNDEPDIGTDVPLTDPIVIGGEEIGPPIDCDGDGLYEDVNGDGKVDRRDLNALVQILIAHRQSKRRGDPLLTSAQEAAFDFNGDGTFDGRDLNALSRKINDSSGCEVPTEPTEPLL